MDEDELQTLSRLLLVRAQERCRHCAEGDEPNYVKWRRWETHGYQHASGADCLAGPEWEVLLEVRAELETGCGKKEAAG